MKITHRKQIAFWSITGLFAGLMVLSGIFYVSGAPMVREAITRLGYPAYILTILGPAKLIGAVALLQTRAATLREWAYAGFTINLIGATASHVFSGDPVAVAATPAMFLLLLAASYALKPRQTAVTSGHVGQTRALAA